MSVGERELQCHSKRGGRVWVGCSVYLSVCLFVSIQGHFPKREAELSTPPLSGPTSADQSPPLLHLSREKLGEGESDSKGRESLCVYVCMHDREREKGGGVSEGAGLGSV